MNHIFDKKIETVYRSTVGEYMSYLYSTPKKNKDIWTARVTCTSRIEDDEYINDFETDIVEILKETDENLLLIVRDEKEAESVFRTFINDKLKMKIYFAYCSKDLSTLYITDRLDSNFTYELKKIGVEDYMILEKARKNRVLSKEELIETYKTIYEKDVLYDNDESLENALKVIGKGNYEKDDVVGLELYPFRINQGILFTTDSICVKNTESNPEQCIIKYVDIEEIRQSRESFMECEILTKDGCIYTIHKSGISKLEAFINKVLYPDKALKEKTKTKYKSKGVIGRFLEVLGMEIDEENLIDKLVEEKENETNFNKDEK